MENGGVEPENGRYGPQDGRHYRAVAAHDRPVVELATVQARSADAIALRILSRE